MNQKYPAPQNGKMKLGSTPLLICIYNRYEVTLNLFEVLKKIKPKLLYVSADGPKNLLDKDLCDKTREIFKNIPWECEVSYLFSENNLGSFISITNSISKVFKFHEKLIILEDDCIPSESFFVFCDELLEKFKHDERISLISGSNFIQGKNFFFKLINNNSYYFSETNLIWGWATWKRVWNEFENINYKQLNDYLDSQSFESKYNSLYRNVLSVFYREMINGQRKKHWDHLLSLISVSKNQYSIVPKKNLVTNIGYGNGSTNNFKKSIINELPKFELDFPIVHPEFFYTKKNTDIETLRIIYNQNWLRFLLSFLLKKFLRSRNKFLKNLLKKTF